MTRAGIQRVSKRLRFQLVSKHGVSAEPDDRITESLRKNAPARRDVMSAGGRRAGQLMVDWGRMATMISEEGRARFSQLRGRYEACKARWASVANKEASLQ